MSLTSASTARLLQYKTHIGAYMKKVSLPLITLILVCSVYSFAQSPGASGSETTKDTATAVWATHSGFSEVGTRGLRQHSCLSQQKLPQCFIEQMTKAGAPADAVSFTRALYDQHRSVRRDGSNQRLSTRSPRLGRLSSARK